MKNRRVLVTGASRGIGAEIAKTLSKDGFEVTVHCLQNIDAAQRVADKCNQYGKKSRILKFDLSDRIQARELLSNDIEENGAYYGVVCNAGLIADSAFPAMEEAHWDSVVHTNLDGFYNVLHPLIMPMIRLRSGGRIVTLSSVSGLSGNRGQVNYSAAKAGIIGASKALAVELAKRKITVNCVAPGVIETEMTENIHPEAMKMIPMNRFGQAAEVADTVSFLVSDKASYITRQVISVNGGMY